MSRKSSIIQRLRIWKYKWLSTNNNITGNPRLFQPAQLNGKGALHFGNDVKIGVTNSPQYYNTYAYIEARREDSSISIGNSVSINNNFCAIANESSIEIHDNVVIGMNCQIYNCDFHHLDPEKRRTETGKSKPVVIESGVFIGNNVIILKGVTIGKNSVIGAGSVVASSITANKIVKRISSNH